MDEEEFLGAICSSSSSRLGLVVPAPLKASQPARRWEICTRRSPLRHHDLQRDETALQ